MADDTIEFTNILVSACLALLHYIRVDDTLRASRLVNKEVIDTRRAQSTLFPRTVLVTTDARPPPAMYKPPP